MSAKEYTKVAPCLYVAQTGIFYALVKRKGRQTRRSLRTRERGVADAELASLRGKLSAGLPIARMTFLDAGLLWLDSIKNRLKARSHRRYRQCVEYVGAQLGSSPVDSLDFTAFVDSREGVAASTYNKDLMVIRCVMRFCVRRQWATTMPDLKPRRARSKRPDVPTREQLAAIVAHIRQQDSRSQPSGDMVELMAASGMRMHEAAELRWADVDTARGVFRVTGGDYGTKNGEARVVPLFPQLAELLARLPRRGDRVLSVKNPRKPFLSACRALGLPGFSRHALRHYFITHALELGVPAPVVASWVGHKDRGVLIMKTYSHVRDEASQMFARRMA